MSEGGAFQIAESDRSNHSQPCSSNNRSELLALRTASQCCGDVSVGTEDEANVGGRFGWRTRREMSMDTMKSASVLAVIFAIIFGAGAWAGQWYGNKAAVTGNKIALYSLCADHDELRNTTTCEGIMAQSLDSLDITKRSDTHCPNLFGYIKSSADSLSALSATGLLAHLSISLLQLIRDYNSSRTRIIAVVCLDAWCLLNGTMSINKHFYRYILTLPLVAVVSYGINGMEHWAPSLQRKLVGMQELWRLDLP